MKQENSPFYTRSTMFHDIGAFLKPYKRGFVFGTILQILGSLAWLLIPWALGEVVTYAARRGDLKSPDYFWWVMVIAILAVFVHNTFHEYARYIVYNIAEKMAIDAKLKTLRHLFTLDVAWQEKENSGNEGVNRRQPQRRAQPVTPRVD